MGNIHMCTIHAIALLFLPFPFRVLASAGCTAAVAPPSDRLVSRCGAFRHVADQKARNTFSHRLFI